MMETYVDFTDELTMIKFLEALYDPEVQFIFFPYIVDESSSTYLFTIIQDL